MKPPKNKKQHYDNIARLGCIITQGPASIHHVHGRSVGARLVTLGLNGVKGVGMRGYGDALIIPLSPELHYIGSKSLDGGMGAEAWEREHGTQADLVDQVSESVGYNLWDLHLAWYGNQKSRRPSGNT